jgi:predicted ATP-grasp superfamily ATP-dependent carboligase
VREVSGPAANTAAKPRILFLALANDVGIDRLPAAMARQGAACALLSPPGFHCAATRFITRFYYLPRHYGIWLGAAFAPARLEAAVRSWKPDLLVPLDDVAALFLRTLGSGTRATQRLRNLIETSLGAPAGYAAASSRAALMQTAARLPVRLPRFHVADDEDATLQAASRFGYPVALKSEHSCGGHGVVVASNAGELRAALARASGAVGLRQRCRAAGRRIMWNAARVASGRVMPPLLQEWVPGAPAMRTVVAWEGRVLEGVSFVAETVHPAPCGASTRVRYVENADMEHTARSLVEALRCSGFMSFDFIIDANHQNAYLIEMNARPICTTHLGRLFGHDIVGALLAQLRGERPTRTVASLPPECAVALFPKDLERDPINLERFRARDILHDVPQDDPDMIVDYLHRLSRIHPSAAASLERLLAAELISAKQAPGEGKIAVGRTWSGSAQKT